MLCWSHVMQLSHLSRFDHDWHRGLHREPIGTIVSNLIRSHHILMSNVIIGLIVEKFCHEYQDWQSYRDHRIRSYDTVTNRNKSYLILFLNRGDRDQPKHRDLLRWVAISYKLLRSVTIREKLPGPINYEAMRMTPDKIRSDTSKCDETRQATILPRMLTICYEL